MKTGTILAATAALLAGCAGAPRFTRTDYVETRDILASIEGELCEVVSWVEETPDVRAGILSAGLDIRKFVASATIGLTVAVETGANGHAGLAIPVGGVVAGGSGTLGTSTLRTRETTLTVYYPFSELECDKPEIAGPRRIAGKLGLADWIRETTTTLFVANETPVSFSYGVGFTLTNTAGLGPTFELLAGASPVSGGLHLGATRAVNHTLSVTVVEIRPDSELAARYRIPDETRRRLERAADIEAIRGAIR